MFCSFEKGKHHSGSKKNEIIVLLQPTLGSAEVSHENVI